MPSDLEIFHGDPLRDIAVTHEDVFTDFYTSSCEFFLLFVLVIGGYHEKSFAMEYAKKPTFSLLQEAGKQKALGNTRVSSTR